ncbi:MAG: hypothetical protein ACJ76G_14500 [Solirubrobacterales bacterium]
MIPVALPPPAPCNAPALRCPDLVMGRPAHLPIELVRGRVRLRGASRLINIGDGPIELRGRRTGRRKMAVTQVIHGGEGGRLRWPTRAQLSFKFIPGQGRYWKLRHAARLEVWSIIEEGSLDRPVRRSEKADYCLRDLIRQPHPPSGAPARRVYPRCDQDVSRASVTLGTSVGWIDRYPSTCYEQYVDVTGLIGRFAFVMRADPDNELSELSDANNAAWVLVSLPTR